MSRYTSEISRTYRLTLVLLFLSALFPQYAGGQQASHWSFQPLKLVAPPVVDSSWPENAVDSFVFKKLQEKQLSPTSRATRQQLIRRLYLDLLGFLPTKQQILEFDSDESPNAWSSLIDKVLASPHYGERWGRHWLDLARYADSNGFEFDFVRPYAWRYRDYVINAFNSDLPYDRFVKEQLAGDEINRESLQAWVATGFCRNGPTVGNQTLEKNRYEELHDVITTTTEVFLGLTVGCARCHDHKFDPISQKDYYAMLAIFNSLSKREHFLGTPEQRRTYDGLRREKKLLEVKAREANGEPQAGNWELLNGVLSQTSMVNNTRAWFGDSSWDNYTLEVEFQRTRGTEQPLSFDAGVYVSVLAPDYQSGYTIQFGASDNREHALFYETNGARSIMQPRVSGTINNDRWYRLTIAVRASKTTVTLDDEPLFEFKDNRHKSGGITLGNWSATTRWRNLSIVDPDGQPLLAQFPAVDAMKRPTQNDGFDVDSVKQQIDAIDEQLARLPLAQAITDESGIPKPTHLHIRGEYTNPGDEVAPSIPAILDAQGLDFPLPPTGAATTGRRRILANWIASERNPLTARVMANRIWQFHFGKGLVETSSNFGLLGFEPSHPELLDWLANELIHSGWSIKHLHRIILESATYQQTSKATADSYRDEDGIYLSRFPIRRHDAEVIRDRILQASGALNLTMGGPGVQPRIEEEVIGTGTTRKWPRVSQESSKHWRRSIYIFNRRSVPFPLLEALDAPVSTSSCSGRITTTVPTQALQLLNSRFTNEQSLLLAKTLLQTHGTNRDALIQNAYWRVLGRTPSTEELELGKEFLTSSELLQPAHSKLRLTNALHDVCHVLINSNEFVFMQ